MAQVQLEQDGTNLFEWRNPLWKGGPGTFAVVLGVSAYFHVEGGSGPLASNTYGLRQLPGSVLTAFRFFEWLEAEYRSSTAPLARCFLALSPSADEQRILRRIAKVPPATFDNCSDAICHWRKVMETLEAGHAAQSRCFFFFSGHGLQVHHDQQVLLPSDYLRPPSENVNQALNSGNLYRGLRALAVPEQFFFLDACRSDHPELRAKNLRGADVFMEEPSAYTYDPLIQPVFYPSGPGKPAYAPVDGDVSVFGQALLEGLLARSGLQVFCENSRCEVRVFSLASFLGRRVQELLAQYGGRERMNVKLGGETQDACVTEVPYRPRIHSWSLPFHLELKGIPPLTRGPSSGWDEEPLTPMAGANSLPREIEALWSQIRVLDVGTGAPVDAQSVEVSGYSVPFPGRRYRLGLRVSGRNEGRALWLQASGDTLACACVVPGENYPAEFTYFILEVNVHSETSAIEHLSLEVDGTHNVSPLSLAARLWRLFRRGELALALSPELMSRLEHVLREKLSTSLGATIAGGILLRLGAFEFLHDWLRNLADWFPSIPDGPVLWMEHLQRDPKWRDAQVLAEGLRNRSLDEELVRQLTRVRERGLPYSVESLSFLASLLERFKRMPVAGMPPELVSELTAQVDRALRFFRPDGFSLSFQGRAHELSPELIRPLDARR